MVAIAVAVPACNFGSPAELPRDAPGDAMIDAPDADTYVWWNPAWTRRRKITIKNDELSGPVANFPILVRLPAEVLVVSPNGNDLRFIADDHATELRYELDTVTTQSALAWVRIPMIAQNGRAPELWVYYANNPLVPTTSDGAMVFGDLYESVHHLDSDMADPDATGHNHTATSSGNQRPGRITGQVGGALDFDGTNDWLVLTNSDTPFDFTTQLSVSAWIRRQVLNTTYQAIVTKGDKSWRLHRENQDPFIGFGTTVANVNDNQSGDVNIDDNNWHHVAIVFESSTKRIYVDGQLDDTRTVGATIDANDFGVAIGRNEEAEVVPDRYWNGDIDEVRISAEPRDLHWMFAEHHVVTDTDFVQLGAEETVRP